ncbi:unnamed protein product [Symbiodinium sp. CCMP2592]|nr:unnamed protein product [Symbiodinium sp. CCMP2592]
MQSGEIVYLRYHGDPGVIHTRLLVDQVQGDEWVIVTPDHDIYVEEPARHNPDIQYMWHSPDGTLARGVPANQVYGFAPMTAAQYAAVMRAGRLEFDAEMTRRGLGAAAVAAGAPGAGGVPVGAGAGAMVAAPAAAPAAVVQPVAAPVAQPSNAAIANAGIGASDLTGRGLVWVAAEGTAATVFGEVIAGIVAPAVEGAKLVHRMPDGSDLFCMCISEASRLAFNSRPAACDGRILARGFNTVGQPERPLSEVAAASREVEMLEARERVDACNCYGVELMFRRVQTIEYAHSERARGIESKTAGTLMIAPSLLEHVKQEVELSKNLRKAREERDLAAMRTPFLSGDARRVPRDIFPLPVPAASFDGGFDGSRRVKRRLERRWHQESMVTDCVRGLNALYSGEKFGKAKSPTQAPSRAQLAALEHIRNSVHLLGAPDQELSGREALRQLHGYGEDQAPPLVASYEPSLLSLPTGEVPPVPLHSLLGGDGMNIVEDFISTRLLQKNEALHNLRRTGVVKCYSDPRLLEARVYRDFVRRLWDGGLVEFTVEEPVEKVEAFFVRKKDGRLRMVVDCRRSNAWFAPPDNLNLATAEVLSRIDLGGTDRDLYISTADLKDAFYHFELPSQLRPYFGMRPLSEGDLSINALGGKTLRASSLIFPRLKVLPMGWTHALWWCQNIHQRVVANVGATAEKCLEDRASVPSPECMHLEYVDNFVCIGTAKDQVEALAAAGVQALRDKGLVVHEVESGEGNIKVLGWCFQGKKLRPLSHRVWRLIAAIRFLLDRGTCSGKQLEKVLGHATFIALGRREALSVFGESYTFVRTHYEQNHRFWPSVRRELLIWTSIAPLLWRDFWIPWSSEVSAVDANVGLGCRSDRLFYVAEVRQLGKYSERWRFEIPEYRCPRASAFGAAAIDDDSDEARSLQWAHIGDGNAKARPVPLSVVEGKLLSDRFVPVAPGQVDRKWRVVGRYKWKRQEGMPVLEGRASLFAVKRLLRNVTSFHKRHLILSDSTAAICALDRGRGRSFGMRRVTQQLACLCLCSGISVQFRFIPSEWRGRAITWLFARAKVRQEFGTLAEASVSRGCRERYSKLWRRMCTAAGLSVTEKYSASDLVFAASQVLEDLFDEGEELSQGQYLIAAIQFYQPHLRGSRGGLDLAKQTLAGWRRLDPPKSRLPLPWEVACLMAMEAVTRNMIEVALYILLAFVTYLRPGEVARLLVGGLVPPIGVVTAWSLILHPLEQGTPSKTGEFDETVLFDLSEIVWIAEQTFRLLKVGHRGTSEPLFSVDLETVRSFMQSVGSRYGMEAAVGDPHPYRLRHGGPSRDILLGLRNLQEVQKRGRWRSFSSVRRYEKGGARHPADAGLVMLWDLRLEEQYDLRHSSRRALICGWIKAGRISGVHLGTPCEKASPGPATSCLALDLFEAMCPSDQIKVELGNLWMRFSVKVVLLCWRLRLCASLKNPLTSRLWLCPPVQHLLRRPHVGRWTTHYCAWGKPFKKPTAFLGVHIDLSVLELHKCRGKRICDFTQQPHVPLQGRTAAGQWRTKWAEPYPSRLCNVIAKAFYNAEVAVLARRFEQCYARS